MHAILEAEPQAHPACLHTPAGLVTTHPAAAPESLPTRTTQMPGPQTPGVVGLCRSILLSFGADCYAVTDNMMLPHSHQASAAVSLVQMPSFPALFTWEFPQHTGFPSVYMAPHSLRLLCIMSVFYCLLLTGLP